MRPVSAALLALLLAGCGDDGGSDDEAADEPTSTTTSTTEATGGFPPEVQRNIVDGCLTSARATAGPEAPEDLLRASCECVLERVQEEYSAEEFAELEAKLQAGTATDAEAGALTNLGVDCAREVSGGASTTEVPADEEEAA
jgi:hypothetical protein